MKLLVIFKKFLGLSLVLSIIISSVYAAPTNKNDAKKAVKGWLKATGRPLKTKMGKEILEIKEFKNDSGEVIYYIVSMKPEGYVVISPDDLIEPIIAFSPKGKFVATSKNPMYSILKKDLPGRLKYIKDLQAKAKKAKKEFTPNESLKKSKSKWKKLKDKADAIEPQLSGADEPVANGEEPPVAYAPPDSIDDDLRVDILLETKWAQGNWNGLLYNYYTPNNLVCGCVATTLAQVVRHFRHPTTGIGVISNSACSVEGVGSVTLETRGGDGAGGPYDWDSMVGIPYTGITDTERQAIGALCYDAGVLCSMSYGTTSYSSNRNAMFVLLDEYQYSNAIWKSSPDLPAFYSMANPSLEAGIPLMITVPGHSIVCDGYGYNSGTQYHHFNMGWGGSSDGWYNVPNVAGYGSIDSIVYNIFVTGTGEIIGGKVKNALNLPQSGITVTADDGQNQYTDVTDDEGNYGIQVPSNATFIVSCQGAAPKNLTTGTSVENGSLSGSLWAQDFSVNNGAQLFYTPTTFNESTLNDGSLTNSLVITLFDDTFTANATSNISVTNLPTGLTAQFIKDSDTQLTVSLTGNADNHGLIDDVTNLTFTFQNGAFTSGDASSVTDYNKSDLVIDFHDTTETLPYAVDSPSLNWTFSGNADWFYQTATTHDAVDAGKSGTITHNQNSTMQTTVIGPGTMTFWWKAESEAGYDKLKVYINGSENSNISGHADWEQKTLTIPAGSVTVKWSYTKDGSRTFYEDTGWVDQVVYTPDFTFPEMQVTRGGDVTDNGTDNVSLTEGGVDKQLTYTITNSGNGDLTLTTPVTTNAVSNCSINVDTQPSGTVAIGNSTDLILSVTPTSNGAWSATVSIANNDVDEDPYNWTISGTAVNLYTVTLNPQSGSGGTTSVEAAVGTAMPAASAPTKTGYIFGGYYTGTGGSGTQYYTTGMASARNWDITSDTTLYAKWTANNYTVNFNVNGGSAANPTSKVVTFGSTYGSLATTNRTGYSFNGWFTQASAGSQVTTGTQVTNASNHTLYAQWTANTYTVTFDKQDGTGGSQSVLAAYESAMPTATAPTLTGYTFGGYYTEECGGGTQYYTQAMASAQNWNITSPTTLYAKWIKTESLTASSDTYISDGATTSNFGSSNILQLCVGSFIKYGLVKFELSSLSGATVTSASLDFTAGGGYAGNLEVCNNTGSWDAATATWNSSNAIVGSTSYGTAIISNATEGTPVPAITFDAAVVQSWIDSPLTNYGVSVKSDYSSVNNTKYSSICSAEHATAGYRPKLTITYIKASSLNGFNVGAISGNTTESGGTSTFTVNLKSQPTADVVIGLSSDDTTEGTVSPSSLTFTNGNWNVNQTVTVTGVNDSIIDGNVAYNIVTGTSTSSDTNYNSLDPADVSVTNTDNDYQLTVSNDGNGSTSPTGASVQTMSSAVAISATADSGYTFDSWTAVSGSPTFGNANQSSTTVTASATAEIKANFTGDQYTVTLDKQSGTGGDGSVSATFGSAMPAAAAPTRGGYAFGGYFTAVDGGGTQYYNADMSSAQNWDISSDTTLYAKWTISDYTVTFDGNGGGTPSPTSTSVTFGNTYGTLATITWTGHTFNGWFTQASGGTEVTSGTTVTATDNHTLYAQWTATQYTITFDSDGGSAVSPITQDYNSAVTPPADPTKTGYTFMGWSPVVPGTMPSSNTTCTAQWNANPVVNAGTNQTVYMTGSNVPWTPADATTIAWYDASDSDNVVVSGTNVTNWKDISGNGYDLNQVAGGNPQYGDGSQINGKNVINLASTFNELYRSGIPDINCTEVCVISVGMPKEAGDYPNLGSVYSTDLSDKLFLRLQNNDISGKIASGLKLDGGSNIGITSSSITDIVDDIPVMLAAYYDGFDGVARVNGGALSQTTDVADGATFTINEIQVGRDSGTPRNYHGEMIVLNTADLTTLQKVEGYLAHKWGLEAKLPAEHPYKSNPPMKSVASATATLAGQVTDADDTPTTLWSKVSGPGTVTFTDNTALNSDVTFTEAGTYILRLTADDGNDQIQDDIVITVTEVTPHSADTNSDWSISQDEVNSFISAYQNNNSATDPTNGNIDSGRITIREVMRVIYLYNDGGAYIGGQSTVDGYGIAGASAPPAPGTPDTGTADTGDTGGDGSLVVSSIADSGVGSLRNAIAIAADGETITIDDSVDTITVLSEIVIDKSITIDGQGAAIVSGENQTRIFRVENPDRDINVTLKNIGIVDATNASDEFGGAIYNNGQTLTLDTVLLDGNANSVAHQDGVRYGKGGAVYSSGTLNVENCVFRNNTASEEDDVYSENGE